MAATVLSALWAPAGEQAQWGHRWSRNMASGETGLAHWLEPGERESESGEINPATTKNVRWVVPLGKRTYTSPVVSDGRVLIGTNNDRPRDDRVDSDCGVLMCFNATTGDFLWQIARPKIDGIRFFDAPHSGWTSTPAIQGDRVYAVSNRGEVMCLDLDGMADGNDGPFRAEAKLLATEETGDRQITEHDADIFWSYDMVSRLNVRQHDASNCSPLIHDGVVYVGTANGLGEEHKQVFNVEAPTLVALDAATGRLLARDGFEVDGDVVHGQWSSPTLGEVHGRPRIYYGAGNGVIYGFDPIKPNTNADGNGRLTPVWRFNGQPEAQSGSAPPVTPGRGSDSFSVVATPVFDQEKLYIAFSHDPWMGNDDGWLAAIDTGGSGDVTRSALAWSFDEISDCLSTAAVTDGLLFLADNGGHVYCLDALTGELQWTHEAGGNIWGSTLVADGRVYVGNNRMVLWVLAAERELRVLSEIRLRDQMFSTPVAAEGVLYFATHRDLYAVESPESQ
jgi:outer membrane protein assembly factor BamB